MIQEFTRRMKPEERRRLEQQVARPSQVSLRRTLKRLAIWFLVLIACLLLILCIAVVSVVAQLPEPIGPILGFIPGMIIVISTGVMVLLILDHRRDARFERLWRKTEVPKLERALADDTAVVRRVQPNAVIEIWQIEDEGDGYIFDLGDGKLLYLQGQRTEPEDENTPWPNTDFEIIRTSRNRLLLDVVCHGHRLEPVRSIAASEIVDYDPWEGFGDADELIEGDLDAFADSLVDPHKGKHPLD